VLHDWSAHPVDLGVPSDGCVVNIHHDHLVVLVGRVLPNPVRVEDPQSLESPSHPFFSNRLKIPFWLLLFHSSRGFGFSIRTTLGNWALAATTSHGDTIDDKSLLSLVPQSTSFIRSCWARSSVDLSQLAILPTPDPEQVPHDIALLLPVQLGHVLVGAHPDLPPSSLVEVNQAVVDKMKISEISKELLEKRQAARNKFDKYRERRMEEIASQKSERLALRDGVDTDGYKIDDQELEEEVVEFLVSEEITSVD